VIIAFVPIIGLVGLPLGILAFIFGLTSTSSQNKGMAVTGIVTGSISVAIALALTLFCAAATSRFSSVKVQAERVSCRSNLRSLGTAESMYYGEWNTFCSISKLASSGVMSYADDLECPTCGRGYTASIQNGGEIYTIRCPNSDSHGSITDGVTSWQ
jgi:hypothetical protein